MALVAVLVLTAAACGSDEPAAAPTAPTGAEVPGELPPNPNLGDTAVASGACVAGEPDCQDTLVGGDAPRDLPSPGDAAAPGGMIADGDIPVADAVASGGEGPYAVAGFLLVDGDGARLCDALAESFPPQCGGAALPIEGYEEVLAVPLTSARGVGWTDQPVSFIGEMVAGSFVAAASSR